MAGFFENIGAYSFATGYASLAYTYSPNTEYLVRCLDDSILSGNEGNIVNFGDKFISDENFEEYCAERSNETLDYKYYVFSSVATAKYGRGDKEGALNLAEQSFEGVSGFPKRNVYAALAVKAIEKGDRAFEDELYNLVLNIDEKNKPLDGEEGHYNQLLAALAG